MDRHSPLRVLIVEDSERELRLLLGALRKGEHPLEYECVTTKTAMKTALRNSEWHVVLSDYHLAKLSAQDALRISRQHDADLPFILVSEAVGEEAAVQLMKAGANDFVNKDRLHRLAPAIDRELKDVEARHQRHIAEKSLRESEEMFRRLVDSSPDAILSLDPHGTILSFNMAASRMWGYDVEDVIGKRLLDTGLIARESVTKVESELKWVLRGESRLPYELTTIGRERTEVFVEANAFPIYHEGDIIGVHMTLRDMTEKRKLEEQLRLAQKMEAIGQLAGGVAHDFNNQLSGIIGCAEILRGELSETQHLSWYADTIVSAAERAASLTRQLLAFARKNKYQTIPVHIHAVIDEVISLLEHTLDPRIEIHKRLQADFDVISGDPSQIQNAILNLAVNARDAMPEGGRLTFTTELIALDKTFCKAHHGEIRPGNFLCLQVEDSGGGMPPEVIPHIFEPFFTTKERGKGTGLGLAAVYGTITSHNGTLEVTSKAGEGSCFKLFLPVRTIGKDQKKRSNEMGHVRGTGHILVVDDELIVRNIAERMLQGLGYTVSTCENGSQAVEFFEKAKQPVDLVLLDMVMPKLNGRDTFFALRDLEPGVKVLLATGHALSGEVQELLDGGVLGLLQKPFRLSELSQAIAEALRS